MDNLSVNNWVKQEMSYFSEDNLEPASVFIKSECFDSTTDDFVDCGSVSYSNYYEFGLKIEKNDSCIQMLSTDAIKLESYSCSDITNLNIKSEYTISKNIEVDPLDLCSMQMGNNSEATISTSSPNQRNLKDNKYSIKTNYKHNIEKESHKHDESSNPDKFSIQKGVNRKGETGYKCKVCKKWFRLKSDIDQHMQLAHSKKLFTCDICKKSFSRKDTLNSHILTHSRLKPYECEICAKSFIQNVDLDRHKLIHSGDRPYECDQCDKRFRQKGALVAHKRVHTGEKPFTCDLCGKKFAVQANVNSHRRVHTVEKPFSCELCDKSFTQLTNLNHHKSRFH